MRINTKTTVAAFIAGAFTLVPVLSNAAEVDGGRINFKGTVVSTACALSTDSADMTIDMGSVGTPDLAAGSTELTNGKDFQIKLTGCDVSAFQNVAITFTGTAAEGDSTALAVGEAGNENSAQHLAIRIYDSENRLVNLNTASEAAVLAEGANTLNFTAKYYTPNGGVTAGDASAFATYTLTYS